MIRNWRAWVLLTLLVGPILAPIDLGPSWLYQGGWLYGVTSLWIGSGIAFAYLAARWTQAGRSPDGWRGEVNPRPN